MRRAPHAAHDLVALLQQQLRQVRPVLAGDSRDERRPAGLPFPGGGSRFRPVFALLRCGAHALSDRGVWLECAKSAARVQSRGTTSATRITRPIAAGTPTCSGCGRWWTGRYGTCASAPSASSRTASRRRPSGMKTGDSGSPVPCWCSTAPSLTQQFDPSHLGAVARAMAQLEDARVPPGPRGEPGSQFRSEEHTSELQSQSNLVCRLLLEKKKKTPIEAIH